jgi:hypothetical protein
MTNPSARLAIRLARRFDSEGNHEKTMCERADGIHDRQGTQLLSQQDVQAAGNTGAHFVRSMSSGQRRTSADYNHSKSVGGRKVNPITETRLTWITNRLLERGGFARSEFIQQFRISPTQASKDIGLYCSMFRDSLIYVSKLRYYFVPGREPKLQEITEVNINGG